MSRKNILLTLTAAVMLGNASLALAGLSPVAEGGFPTRASQPSANYLDIRQYKIEDGRVPGTSTRQSMMAWQVIAGSWNGQSLDGLSVVIVQHNLSESSGSPRQTCCYVSDYATPAQREALLAAMRSTQPQLRDLADVRLEPAVIRLDMTGDATIIHLGLIS